MLTAIIIILFALILLLDLLPNFKKWIPRERCVYLALFSASFILLLLFTLDVKLPSFYDIFKPLLQDILPDM